MNDLDTYKQQQQIRQETAASIKTIWVLFILTWVLFLLPFCGSSVVGWILNGVSFMRLYK